MKYEKMGIGKNKRNHCALARGTKQKKKRAKEREKKVKPERPSQ